MPETSRLSAAEILARSESVADEEMARPSGRLGVSALAAGLAMGLSGLGVALLLHSLGRDGSGKAVAHLAYPIGFLVVILGRQQLFTENTLFPVARVLSDRRHLSGAARLWGVVLLGNVAGTLLFAALMTQTPAISPAVASELARLGLEQGEKGFATVFWSGVVGGWIIALVAWLVTACRDTSAQVLVIVLLTYLVGVGQFAHSIAGSADVLTAVLAGDLPLTSCLTWLSAAVLGNAAGGVLLVALLNHGQVGRP